MNNAQVSGGSRGEGADGAGFKNGGGDSEKQSRIELGRRNERGGFYTIGSPRSLQGNKAEDKKRKQREGSVDK